MKKEDGPIRTEKPPQTRAAATPGPDEEEFAAMCRSLGHPARVKILKHLLEVDRCICGEIVRTLPLAQSTVSQHLKSLKQSGLIRGEIEGPATCYCVDKTCLKRFLDQANALFARPEETEAS